MYMTRSQLIGLPLVEKESGRILGRIVEIEYLPGERALRGLYYRTGGFLHRTCRLPMELVTVMGAHAVICRRAPQQAAKVPDPLERTAVYSQTGEMLGRLGDILVDPANYAVTGMELRRSFLDDLRDGRPVIRDITGVRLQAQGMILPVPSEESDSAH